MQEIVRLSSKARQLKPVIEEWLAMYPRVASSFPQDAGFWYNERTLAALISSASWRRNIPSIAEAKTIRRAARNSKRPPGGHLDVLISDNGRNTAIEAKITWLSNPDGVDDVLGKLADARSEAASLPRTYDRRLALSFGVLERRELEPAILLKEALAKLPTKRLDVLAWTLDRDAPSTARYPGCIVAGRVVP